jgi:hypothetical protein
MLSQPFMSMALYKERRLNNFGGKSVKYGQEILELLDTV